MSDTIQILELFGGIGSPRCALRNLNIPTKAIDYVEINEKAVRSYNSMFREELAYKTQTVVGWKEKRRETEESTEEKVRTRGAEHVPLSCGRQYISLRTWENGDLDM